MTGLPRWRDLDPLRVFRTSRFSYQRVPNGSPFDFQQYRWPSPGRLSEKWRFWSRMSTTRLICFAIASVVFLSLLVGGGYHTAINQKGKDVDGRLPWQHYYRLDGYYNGVRTLVPHSKWEPDNKYNQSIPPTQQDQQEELQLGKEPPLNVVKYNPYPNFASEEYRKDHQPVQECFLDDGQDVRVPDVYAYPGLPQHMVDPFFGSYKTLGLADDVCFERFGRLGPYGYGYNVREGGIGIGNVSERAGSEQVFAQTGYVNYTNVDWGSAQKQCFEKNKARFSVEQPEGKKRVQRHAYVLRTWTGYQYSEYQILSLRAMIAELALKSGGEYDVHFLVHVKNNSIPIWASQAVYKETLQKNVPREFWNISTLWSELQMVNYYPEPFPDNFANMAGAGIHGVYRSAHFPLQWFSQQHPEYDFIWNWEMDVRYSGHYWEFNNKVGEWAKKQPRKGLWERGRRYYIPHIHGDWANFTSFVERETQEKDIATNDIERSGPVPVWGAVRDFANSGMLPPFNATLPPHSYDSDNYQWGVGEDADLIVFNPLFDPSLTNWVFSWDVTGYNRSLPVPPRRAAIITVARLSKRLLQIMHDETWAQRHTMFAEMWPPSVCFHHGLKAVYAPHPVYFDRDWELEHMNQVFNYPKEIWDSPFGWGEHNLLGSSFYYNSGFSGALWRRWLGQAENHEGGRRWEEERTGRMCLRATLHHPIKTENGPVDPPEEGKAS
ncbi:hypothetical protein BAUCODRAFT_30291 [Baudoinia panamericana UAMH 10762]|uniref:Major facilitator superfamily transporter n=1 Tax=Baudoinia panamericana (strain UAMH 10762) TaxID=717646 RepID=M2NL52_BAUPA|nr:uncharacterized protein BAUCODRAFT_30291 [Baudoinia panamericana UAMH 10762]EMC99880.1 hypothetical protein BAUCODRAFT_30291 [Baudoinia panamericana UAMH 10762]